MKLLWDFRIQTDRHLDHNRPDIVVLEKASRVCQIIDVACPFDTRIAEKERVREDRQLPGLKSGNTKDVELQIVSVAPIVIGSLAWGSEQKLDDEGYQDI